MTDTQEKPAKKLRGFAAMDPAKQLAIARKGGAAVPREKRAFSVNNQLAMSAGSKGGRNVAATSRSFSKSRALAQAAGRAGGQASHAPKPKPKPKPEAAE